LEYKNEFVTISLSVGKARVEIDHQ
jgi:hypothetical protein